MNLSALSRSAASLINECMLVEKCKNRKTGLKTHNYSSAHLLDQCNNYLRTEFPDRENKLSSFCLQYKFIQILKQNQPFYIFSYKYKCKWMCISVQFCSRSNITAFDVFSWKMFSKSPFIFPPLLNALNKSKLYLTQKNKSKR